MIFIFRFLRCLTLFLSALEAPSPSASASDTAAFYTQETKTQVSMFEQLRFARHMFDSNQNEKCYKRDLAPINESVNGYNRGQQAHELGRG